MQGNAIDLLAKRRTGKTMFSTEIFRVSFIQMPIGSARNDLKKIKFNKIYSSSDIKNNLTL